MYDLSTGGSAGKRKSGLPIENMHDDDAIVNFHHEYSQDGGASMHM